MPPEQAAAQAAIATRLSSWSELLPSHRDVLRAALRPRNGFTPEQREIMEDHWLEVTQGQVDAMNAALPAGVRVQARAARSRKLYLSMDLLTDCDTYAAIAGQLAAAKIGKVPPTLFPSPEYLS